MNPWQIPMKMFSDVISRASSSAGSRELSFVMKSKYFPRAISDLNKFPQLDSSDSIRLLSLE